MGLFDIFKRRSKKAKEKKAREQAAKEAANQVKEDQKEDQNKSEFSENHRDKISSSAEKERQSDTVNLGQSKSVPSSTVDSSESAVLSSKSDLAESEIAESSETIHNKESADSATEKSANSSHSVDKESSADSKSSENTSLHSIGSNKSSSSSSIESLAEKSETSENSISSSANSSETDSQSVVSASEDSEKETFNATSEEDKTQDSNESEDQVKDDNAKQDAEKYEHGLAKSRSSFGQKLNELFANFRSVDDDFFDNLEDTLIESDVGFDMAIKLTDQLRDEVKLKNVKKAKEVQNVVVEKLIQLYDDAGDSDVKIHFADKGPTVILFVGVNGVGKTTTIGKMANQYHKAGKKVLLAAADTFRAGAIQQLDVWAKRAHVDIVKRPEGSDPASVVYEATQKAKAENYDILFVDTAGRLQNKINLMNELSKMKKVLTREIPSAPHEVLLVLDATTGQNALNQAKLFKDTTNVTGIVLTKLDGSARGGIILAIRSELHIPVKLVGLGEQINDLRPFDANDYVYGLFKGLLK